MVVERVAMGFYFEDQRGQWDYGIAYLDNLETHCHICKKPFNIYCYDRVRDPDHVTWKYLGPAPKWCNIRLRRTCKIRTFHNFRGYDSHFIAMAIKDVPKLDSKIICQRM